MGRHSHEQEKGNIDETFPTRAMKADLFTTIWKLSLICVMRPEDASTLQIPPGPDVMDNRPPCHLKDEKHDSVRITKNIFPPMFFPSRGSLQIRAGFIEHLRKMLHGSSRGVQDGCLMPMCCHAWVWTLVMQAGHDFEQCWRPGNPGGGSGRRARSGLAGAHGSVPTDGFN